MTSLRRTLVLTLLGAVTAVTLVGALASYRLARRGIDEIFDYHLRQIALSLRDQAMGEPPMPGDETGGRFDFVIQIWSSDGERLYLSRPGTGLPEFAELGYGTVPTRTGTWRVYSAALGHQVIQVAQPLAVRNDLAVAAAARTLSPLLLLLPLLALLVWRVVGRGLRPLDRLASAAQARTPAALDPFQEAGVPQEVLPLVRALNDLLRRLAAALASQRAFVGDAAHELRTPLAALKLQVQLAARAEDGHQRAAALADVESGLERATHVVQQLLTLAREEPEAAGGQPTVPVALAELVRQAVADHAILAEARGIDLGATRLEDEAVVQGDAATLRTLLANLVDNAIRYTPRGGRVDVAATVSEGHPHLEVADTGPGIPAAERKRVFDRFYRRHGGEAGSGLGLAIVKAVAERHRAVVTLGDTAGGGLTARVDFALDPAGRDEGPVRAGPR